jgi:hypothetical protein
MQVLKRPDEKEKTKEVSTPDVPELERLRIHNLYLQQKICHERLNLLTLQFLQTAEPKALQQQIDEFTSQIEALAQRIFSNAELDPRQYQLNIDRGVFVPRPQHAP